MELNILIVGVGGQGTLLASRVLGKYAELSGLDCKLSEVHGMAQRGGSVVTHIKIAPKVFSPLVEEGFADVLLSFEQLEAVRWVNYIKREGTVICNSQQIMPMPVVTGSMKYPDSIKRQLAEYTDNVMFVDALEAAKTVGNIKTVNTIMLAVLAKVLKLDIDKFERALSENVPQKTLEINMNACKVGYSL